MEIYFGENHHPIQPKIYLGTPGHKVICVLNGIVEESFQMTQNLNNTSEISFEIDRYIMLEGRQIESNAYQLIDLLMNLYVENIGWFILKPVETNNDGLKERKSITAESAEIELLQHDLINLKINKGTTDSYEMLVDGNVEIIDEVEFAKEQIKFCNKQHTDLSLLHILLKCAGVYGWNIGYIDDTPKIYSYYEDGVLKEKQVCLSDEIGTFEIDRQNLYSFFTQTAAQFFNCVFLFDSKTFTINVYRPENLGKETNINIGFRNLQNSNEVSINGENIFTKYTVYGADDLGVQYVNFGSNVIENLTYFLNEKYMPKDLITKYKLWASDVETKRALYIEETRLYNKQQKIISELYDRVPLDDCSTEWNKFTSEELVEAQAIYEAQLKGYESYYIDDQGNFDQAALDASVDANDYYQIKDVILPSIKIEINNREDLTKDPTEYIDSYKTNWKLYGLDELQVNIDNYQNIKKTCEDGKYNKPYTDDCGHTEDMHTEMYNKYVDACNQLDASYLGSCMEAYKKRKKEIDNATAIQSTHNENRKEIAIIYDKEKWKHDDFSFTVDDINILSKLYIETDYNNDNMFLTGSDDSVSAIDEQLKLLNAANEDLYIASQPQFIYSTDLDNFLSKYDYKNYTTKLNLGDFIYLGVNDENVAKLRLISISYNPLLMDNNLQLEFSNMILSQAGRNDISDLLNSSSNNNKGTSSGSSNNSLSNEGIALTSGIVQKLISSSNFSNKVNQLINNEFAGYIGKLISVQNLNAEMIKATDIVGVNGFFEYLQAKLITAGKIVADDASFKKLQALFAQIDNLIAGNVVAELGHVIRLTAENVNIDEAVIRDLIAANITVSMLQAGAISSNSFNITSDDGGLEIVGNTMQFKDKNGTVRIQIGRDAKDNFTFCLYDETGNGVLIDSTGIKESAIGDGIIKNDMLAGGITKDKLAFRVVETDENGKIDAALVLINGEGLEAKFTTIENTVSDISSSLDSLAYVNVTIGNESQNIPCDATGKTNSAFLIEIPFSGYKGTERIPCNANIGVLPSGVTLGSNTASTESTDGKIVLNVTKGATLGNSSIIQGKILIDFFLSEKSITKSFTWTKTKDGTSGSSARTYTLEPSTLVLKKGSDDILTPPNITFSAFYRDGANENRSAYSGRFVISESTNGTTFTNKYLSSVDESSVIYTPSASTVRVIKCILYASGGISNALDTQSVIVLTDIDNIQIGNRNLLLNSGEYISNSTYLVNSYPTSSLKPNTAYTMVLHGTITEPNQFGVWCNNGSTNLAYFPVGQTDSANIIHFTTPDSISNTDIRIYNFPEKSAQPATINWIAMYEGNIVPPMDWTPAPEDLTSQMETVKNTISDVSLKVDNNTKSISQKASQSDIDTSINKYDGSTVKTIRDQVAEHTTEIGTIRSEVKDVTSTVAKKADGSTVTEISEKLAKAIQDAEGFKNTVAQNYASKDSLKDYSTTTQMNSAISQSANSIKNEVSSTYVNKNTLNNYSTTTQMNTAISQSATSIKNEVSSTYETKEHATSQYSLIDQRAGKIESTVTNVKNMAEAANTFANNAKNNFGYQYKVDIVVKGDANTYYPVIIKGGDQNVKRNILVARGYYEQAPDTWNTATHKGGLTLHLKTNFGGWGGANYSWAIHDLEEVYCRMFAGAVNCANNCMFAIFLRGGGDTGAIYHIYSDQSLTTNVYKPTADTPAPQICYNSDPIFLYDTHKANAPAPRTITAAVEAEIKQRLYVKLSQENYATITTVKQTVDAIELEVRTARGASSTLAVRINEIVSRVSNAEIGYTELLQTAGTIQQSISGLDGRMSSVTSTAAALQSRLTTAEGEIATVNATAKALSTTVGNLEKNIGTKFQQTEKDFTATIQALQNSLNNTLYKNFKFDANGITISSGNSNITLRVDNTGINFYNGSSLVAYINSNKLHITDATVVDNMQIGGFGYTQMSNGSLSFGKL